MVPAIQAGGRVSYSGVQKCAIVCMALGPKEASKILQNLDPDQVELVAREVLTMEPVKPETVQSILAEFERVTRSVSGLTSGGETYARQILEQALGADRASTVMGKLGVGAKETGLERLGKASPEILASILRAEHPQISAIILAHLEPERAAKILQAMDSETAADVLYRIARMEEVSPEMLSLVASSFEDRAEVSLDQRGGSAGGAAATAKLINLTGGEKEREILEQLEGRDPETTGQIKALMFVFEDLLLVDGKGIQRILREVDTKELALALKAASEELKKHIKSNMSERAGSALDEEIELLGPVRVRDVEAAHAHIIEAVRQLDESGEIMIRRPGADSDIIQ